jgi:hypothetical protein
VISVVLFLRSSQWEKDLRFAIANGLKVISILNAKSLENDWLIDWAKKWIDELDEKQEDANGLTGVIHSVTKPELENETFSFSVDFGSAGIDAFLELINEIYLQNIRSIHIGSFSIMSENIDAKRIMG